MPPSEKEKAKYSYNDYQKKQLEKIGWGDKKTIPNLMIRTWENNGINTFSADKKIYTETQMKEIFEFICAEDTQKKNPFCGKENCPNEIPSHYHSKEADNEMKLEL